MEDEMTRDDNAQQPADEAQQEEQEIEGDVPSSTADGDAELTIEEQLANAEARRNATIEVVSRLLPILDDFERALDTVPEDVAANTWFEGVALVYRKLRSILETVDIERIEALGQPFDPNLHEAVLQEESDEHESGIVIKELQKGYRLNDRVIRPAMVVVAA